MLETFLTHPPHSPSTSFFYQVGIRNPLVTKHRRVIWILLMARGNRQGQIHPGEFPFHPHEKLFRSEQ